MKSFTAIFACLAGLAMDLNHSARGASTVVFSDYGPGYSYLSDETRIVDNGYWVATPFVPNATAKLGRVSVTIYAWQPPYQFRFTVAADNHGLPGATLESWSVTPPFSYSLVNMYSANNPVLTNGVPYWLVASADTSGTEDGWCMSPTAAGNWSSTDQGATWTYVSFVPDGTFEVDGLNPLITSIATSGTNALLTATNGFSDHTYITLTATNLTAPPAQWQPVATNAVSSPGGFIINATNAVNKNASQQFYILKMQ